MNWKIILKMCVVFLLWNCTENTSGTESTETDAREETRPEGWTQSTHGKDAEPDYETVFPESQLKRLDIQITEANWSAMMVDMESKYGSFGGQTIGAPGGMQPPLDSEGSGDDIPGTLPPGNMPEPVGAMALDGYEDPSFFPVTVVSDNISWENVGMRFKGNSSLSGSWGIGSYKMPFKLDFDEFEDEYPEIDDQRFYGFKKLSFSNAYQDASYMRDKLTSELFRSAGIPAPRAAFYQIYVDYGEGEKYFGLYTAVEIVDDTFLSDWFGEEDGNCYKPDGDGASFREGSYNPEDLVKKNNEEEADYSDVETLYNTLHSDLRLSEPESWQDSLEQILNVEGFLNWLSANIVVQNWDVYGSMTHNYYLYEKDGRLNWIPWDNNEALNSEVRGSSWDGSFEQNVVDENWPLIRYVLDQEKFTSIYQEGLRTFREDAFGDDVLSRIQELERLIQFAAEGEQASYTVLNTGASFTGGVSDLKTFITQRMEEVDTYLVLVDGL